MDKPPLVDQRGLNILDPNDRLGLKSRYITLLQQSALRRHLPKGDGKGVAVDLGCGYGRLSVAMGRQGWQVVGVDPDRRLLEYARRHSPGVHYCQARLPELPFRYDAIDLLVLHNLLRPLLLMGILEVVRGIGAYLAPQGRLVVVDNIRDGHPAYVPEADLVRRFEAEGLRLERRIPLRAGRWWVVYLIRYGFIPARWLERLADYELQKRQHQTRRPRWQYLNVMFVFRKVDTACPVAAVER